jgi:ribonuclease HI
MEITAAIIGLKALKYPCMVTLYTDSKYLANAIEEGWALNWRSNGWRRKDKKPAMNVDLWEELLMLLEQHQVRVQWVKGHANIPENEHCDRLATEFAQRDDLPEDAGYCSV